MIHDDLIGFINLLIYWVFEFFCQMFDDHGRSIERVG